jgi:hypothetical protein
MMILPASLVALTIIGQPAEAPAEQPPVAAPQAALDQFLAEAKGYVITQRAAKDVRLEFSPQPLLHWANPARNGEDGAVFVWLSGGRPEVIGSVFEYPSRGSIVRKHAFHSLSSDPLLAQLGDVEIWSPQTPGVKFAPMPGADPPADSPRRRLSQMRDLARQFSLELVDLKESKSELRLMTQPLFRYEPTVGPAQDGAIFAFAIGTDPEALLLLESRKSGGAFRWEYAFARFHFVTISATLDGRQVWKVEPDRDMMRTVYGRGDPQREKIYYSVMKSVTMP